MQAGFLASLHCAPLPSVMQEDFLASLHCAPFPSVMQEDFPCEPALCALSFGDAGRFPCEPTFCATTRGDSGLGACQIIFFARSFGDAWFGPCEVSFRSASVDNDLADLLTLRAAVYNALQSRWLPDDSYQQTFQIRDRDEWDLVKSQREPKVVLKVVGQLGDMLIREVSRL